jgi:hypothetical protein
MFGVSYNEIRNAVLSMPAKEKIVFIMACYSGNLVNSFNQQRAQWENYQSTGRNLLVFASSKPNEESSTGPITDSDEPNGPSGSAGSAYGHALWKSLIGYADGYVDGVKDGFLTLDEIIKYTTRRTQQIGGHTPIFTGSFNANLIMNKVPGEDFITMIGDSTEGMSDEEVAARVEALDRAMRL